MPVLRLLPSHFFRALDAGQGPGFLAPGTGTGRDVWGQSGDSPCIRQAKAKPSGMLKFLQRRRRRHGKGTAARRGTPAVVPGAAPGRRWCWLVGLAVLPAAWASQPPLTDVEALLLTNAYEVTVRCQVADPVLGRPVRHNHAYSGNAASFWRITDLTVSSGMVAWVAQAAGSYGAQDRDMVYAVYDPALQTWRERAHRYEGCSLGAWTLSAPTLADGVVLWHAQGSGALYSHNAEIGFSVYDPVAAAWRAATRRYSGTDSSYWVITNRQTAGGLVLWTCSNAGSFALGHQKVHFAVFDPYAARWNEGSQYYESHLNDAWRVTGQRIASQTVAWTATNRTVTRIETRGYSQPLALWTTNSTTPTAAFAASVTTGAMPLSVWFTDLSIGATNWNWSFGGPTNVTARSPLHVFAEPGVFVVTQTVEGPGGRSAAQIYVTVDTAQGRLEFDTPRITLTNDQIRLPIAGASGVAPVILETSANLLEWLPIATNLPQPGPMEFTAPVNPLQPARFYRAVVPQ
ncbi:MAG: PKD domain-containing protein [Verrucomicrobia bacterium]|nr:PKD domain-containing protein [Verrucomicrobiota bacterium]